MGCMVTINESEVTKMIFKREQNWATKNNAGDWASVTVFQIRGTSDETKPTDGIGYGSEFIELDTGSVFLFDGTDWNDVSGQ